MSTLQKFQALSTAGFRIKEHRRLKTLAQQITRLALAKVRTHVLDRRRKAGRL
jgi:predicted acetyltransferase